MKLPHKKEKKQRVFKNEKIVKNILKINLKK